MMGMLDVFVFRDQYASRLCTHQSSVIIMHSSHDSTQPMHCVGRVVNFRAWSRCHPFHGIILGFSKGDRGIGTSSASQKDFDMEGAHNIVYRNAMKHEWIYITSLMITGTHIYQYSQWDRHVNARLPLCLSLLITLSRLVIQSGWLMWSKACHKTN